MNRGSEERGTQGSTALRRLDIRGGRPLGSWCGIWGLIYLFVEGESGGDSAKVTGTSTANGRRRETLGVVAFACNMILCLGYSNFAELPRPRTNILGSYLEKVLESCACLFII